MPGYDENVSFAAHLEPPRLDADETLPSQVHPSYPYGRPKTAGSKPGAGAGGAGARAAGNLLEPGGRMDEKWEELDLSAVLEHSDGREVPPVMAVSVPTGDNACGSMVWTGTGSKRAPAYTSRSRGCCLESIIPPDH